jgi:hypothetical protein
MLVAIIFFLILDCAVSRAVVRQDLAARQRENERWWREHRAVLPTPAEKPLLDQIIRTIQEID